VVVSICSVRETRARVFSVTAARHCPQPQAPFSAGIRWLLLSGVLALSAYATKMGRSLVPALLAEEARSIEEARDYYAKGVEAGELALGPEGFQRYAGHFWGFLETRPYMRARAGLAGALLKLGDVDGALSHYRDMLKLNPSDNQGIRYVLAGCLLRQDNYGALRELLAAHEDGSAFWLYTRALLAFRESGDSDEQAAALVRDAWSANEHVPAILAGTKPPAILGRWLRTMGGPDEANLLRHRMRPGVAPYAGGGRVADKARRHFGAETSDPCDYALISAGRPDRQRKCAHRKTEIRHTDNLPAHVPQSRPVAEE